VLVFKVFDDDHRQLREDLLLGSEIFPFVRTEQESDQPAVIGFAPRKLTTEPRA